MGTLTLDYSKRAPLQSVAPQPRSTVGQEKLTLIAAAVAEAYDVGVTDLRRMLRTQELVDARFAFFALARELTEESLETIGFFVNRDPGCVTNGVRVLKDRCEVEPAFATRFQKARDLAKEKLAAMNPACRRILAYVTYDANGKVINISPL